MPDHEEENEHERIDSPTADDEKALRDYGRQLALDSLVSDAFESEGSQSREPSDVPTNVVSLPDRRTRNRFWVPAAAAAIVGLIALSIWKFFGDSGSQTLASLDPRWTLSAAGGAEYQILSTDRVELRRGELRLTSNQPASLVIETPHAKATAQGTDFFIGHHMATDTRKSNETPENEMNQNPITRLLVLAGSVTLATDQGTATASPGEAAIAEQDKAPEKILAEANSSFAFDLYAQLVKENTEDNLFFSPYSMSNALMMVTEGARGQTARELGKVLGFPEALLRTGEEGQQIPWEIGVLRSGLSRLNQLLGSSGESLPPEQAKLRQEAAALEKRWEELKKNKAAAEEKRDFDTVYRIEGEEARLVGKLNALRGNFNTMKLRVANALWGEQTFPFHEAWKRTVTGAYGAGAVKAADFLGNAEEERQRINAWAEKQTEGRIKNLFPSGTIKESTRLALVNAIYFKGDWLVPFKKANTRPEKFQLASGASIEAPLMQKNADRSTRYAAFDGDGSFFATPVKVPFKGEQPPTYPGKDGFAIIEMPYRGGEVSMVVIAPNDPTALAAIEVKLSDTNVAKWIASLKQRRTHVRLPKFKMETSYTLSETLATMGMPTVFDPVAADLSGISSADPLFISTVMHKAFINVNEEGTEAAAATGMGVDSEALPTTVPFTPTFRADRPFIYLIRDTKTGAVLFLGRVLNPSA